MTLKIQNSGLFKLFRSNLHMSDEVWMDLGTLDGVLYHTTAVRLGKMLYSNWHPAAILKI